MDLLGGLHLTETIKAGGFSINLTEITDSFHELLVHLAPAQGTGRSRTWATCTACTNRAGRRRVRSAWGKHTHCLSPRLLL